MKATSLIFGIIITSLFMGSFGLMISDVSSNYGVDYNSTQIDLFNKLNETESQAYELQAKLNSTTDTSVIDVVGGFVTKAVDSLKLTYRSMGSAISMTESATETLNLPRIFTTAFISMIIIFIVLGVIISAMIKKDL